MSYRENPKSPRFVRVSKTIMLDLDDVVAIVLLDTDKGRIFLRSYGKMEIDFDKDVTLATMDAWEAYTAL